MHQCEHHRELSQEESVRKERKEYLLSRIRHVRDMEDVRQILAEIVEAL